MPRKVESRNETVKIDYGIEDSCIGNEGTERQKKKEKRDLTRQRESILRRRAARTDQQRQAILQRRALICVHVNYICNTFTPQIKGIYRDT